MGDKTQALLVRGQSVRICKHRRKVGGEYASVRDIFWREEEPWVVLQLPSGRRTAAPASWTDLPLNSISVSKSRMEMLPSALPELAQYCQRLRRPRRRPRKKSNRGKRK